MSERQVVRPGQLWRFRFGRGGAGASVVVMVLWESGQRFSTDMMDDDEVCHDCICVWSDVSDEGVGDVDIWSVGMRYARRHWELLSDVPTDDVT